jgi:predicted alpha/beta superfamily hydrolase
MRVGLTRLLGLLLLTACATAHPQPAPPAVASPAPAPGSTCPCRDASSTPISLGETFRLSSGVLGEQRVINVHLPPGYEKGGGPFPVLYALDGGMQEDFPHVAGNVDVAIRNEVIRPVLVVGVENIERRRDLVSATTVEKERHLAPHAGGTDRFRRFLREELKPEIARRYRVSDESAVVGESLAGLFVLETLLQDPELFDAYVAIDPSVWWSAAALVKSAPERFARWSAKPKRLYVATADFKETQDAVGVLMTAIRASKPAGLTVTYEPFPGEHHSTIFPVAEVRAYRVLFADGWSPAQ